MELKKERSTVLFRQFDGKEPENYWYRVCQGEAAKYVQRPWHALWKSKRLMNIVSEISGRMDWDFDALHVVRGEKAKNTQLWPHLEYDTSPDRRPRYKVHLLDDYKDLWSNTSEWYNDTTTLNNGHPVEFDGYMRVEVDTEVLYRAKTRVETFTRLQGWSLYMLNRFFFSTV